MSPDLPRNPSPEGKGEQLPEEEDKTLGVVPSAEEVDKTKTRRFRVVGLPEEGGGLSQGPSPEAQEGKTGRRIDISEGAVSRAREALRLRREGTPPEEGGGLSQESGPAAQEDKPIKLVIPTRPPIPESIPLQEEESRTPSPRVRVPGLVLPRIPSSLEGEGLGEENETAEIVSPQEEGDKTSLGLPNIAPFPGGEGEPEETAGAIHPQEERTEIPGPRLDGLRIRPPSLRAEIPEHPPIPLGTTPERPPLPPDRLGARPESLGKEVRVPGEIMPWEDITIEEEAKLSRDYESRSQVGPETKKAIMGVLRDSADEARVDFALRWFEDKRSALEGAGIPTDVSTERRVAIAIEKGAFRNLKRDSYYEEDNRRIDNLSILRAEFGRDVVSMESQFLVLNVLENRKKALEEAIGGSGLPEERRSKETELGELLKLRRELAEKLSGRDFGLESEAINEEAILHLLPENILTSPEGEEQWRRIQSGCFQAEWNALPPKEKRRYGDDLSAFAREETARRTQVLRENLGMKDISSVDFLSLYRQGYKLEEIRRAGLFRTKIEIRGTRISNEEFAAMRSEGRDSFREELESAVRKSILERERKRWIDGEMSYLATSPERAVGGIETMYRELRDRLIEEFRGSLKKGGQEAVEKVKAG